MLTQPRLRAEIANCDRARAVQSELRPFPASNIGWRCFSVCACCPCAPKDPTAPEGALGATRSPAGAPPSAPLHPPAPPSSPPPPDASSSVAALLAHGAVHRVVARQEAKVGLHESLDPRDHLGEHVCHACRAAERHCVEPVGCVRLWVHDEVVGVFLVVVLADAERLAAHRLVVADVAEARARLAGGVDALRLLEVLVLRVHALLEAARRGHGFAARLRSRRGMLAQKRR
ncbi:hypothetical protein T492DRAFT_221776, partial [Pavlovales sp. CCMP2436]